MRKGKRRHLARKLHRDKVAMLRFISGVQIHVPQIAKMLNRLANELPCLTAP